MDGSVVRAAMDRNTIDDVEKIFILMCYAEFDFLTDDPLEVMFV